MLKKAILAATLATGLAGAALAADKYEFDPSHSQIIFSYDHLGYSTTYGMYSGFTGEAMLDAENPANSSVTVSMKATDMITGWDKRTAHFMSADFFNAEANPDVKFVSTSVEPTGEKTAKVTGDLTMNGVTKPVTLNTTLTQISQHPMANKMAAGFNAETTIKRSEWNLGKFAPNVGDEVKLMISVEMLKAE